MLLHSTRHVVTAAVVGILALQSLAASDSWSRVTNLKSKSWIYVQLADGNIVEGAFLSADDSVMNVRAINQGEVALARDLVMQVAVNHSGRRWYSMPLAVMAGAAGGASGYGIVSRATCSTSHDDCAKALGFVTGISAAGAAALTYRLTLSTSKKVVYQKKQK
jgi:hypothetical protein